MTRLRCPACGQVLSDSGAAGTVSTCPQCHRRVRIPHSEPPDSPTEPGDLQAAPAPSGSRTPIVVGCVLGVLGIALAGAAWLLRHGRDSTPPTLEQATEPSVSQTTSGPKKSANAPSQRIPTVRARQEPAAPPRATPVAPEIIATDANKNGQEPPDRAKTEQAAPDDERVLELWKRHRHNFTSVDGKAYPVHRFGPFADRPLGPMHVGASGRLGRCRVFQVMDGTNILLTTDREELFRLTGIPTGKMAEGQDYLGRPEVVIVGTWQSPTVENAGKPVFLAVTMEQIRDGIPLPPFRRLVQEGADLGPDREQLDRELALARRRQAAEDQARTTRERLLGELEATRQEKTRCLARLEAARRRSIINPTIAGPQMTNLQQQISRLEAQERDLMRQLGMEPDPDPKAAKAAEPVDREGAAANKLKLAKKFEQDGDLKRAKEWYRKVVEEYPNTKAAGEARKWLGD